MRGPRVRVTRHARRCCCCDLLYVPETTSGQGFPPRGNSGENEAERLTHVTIDCHARTLVLQRVYMHMIYASPTKGTSETSNVL